MGKSLTPTQAMRYSRHILLPEMDLEGQEALLNASVLQLGVGGLGCACAQYLVSSGVGRLTLVDDDSVDSSNLQRQILHREQDVGINKAESARDTLQQLNSECDIKAITRRLDKTALTEAVTQHDLVLDCTDNLESRQMINQICQQQAKPLVSGAAIRFEGQVCSFLPNQSQGCYACMSRFFTAPSLSCVESGVLSPLVGVIGSMQAIEALKILSSFGVPLAGRLLLFDASTMEWQQITIPKHPLCQVCNSSS